MVLATVKFIPHLGSRNERSLTVTSSAHIC